MTPPKNYRTLQSVRQLHALTGSKPMQDVMQLTGNKVHRVFVHLAANEWGSETMEQIARQTADEHKDKKNLLITVYEHGGWFLTWFANNDGVFTIVGSANESAVFEGQRKAIREFLKSPDLEWNYLPEIWRGRTP